MHRDELLLFIIKSHERHIAEIKIRDQEKMRIMGHGDTRIIFHLEPVNEGKHGIKGQGGDHEYLCLTKLIYMFYHLLRFMFAVFTHGTEQHQQNGSVLWKVIAGIMRDTIR